VRLRVALVHPFCWPEVRRGGERYLHDLAWYLGQAGHEVHVVTGTRGGPPAGPKPGAGPDATGARVHMLRHRTRLPFSGRELSPAETFGAVALPPLLRHRFDVVHALTPTAAIAAAAAGHRVIYTVLGIPTAADFAERGGGAAALFRLAVFSSQVTTALSCAAERQVLDLTGRRAEVLYPGVRLDVFRPELRPRTGPPRLLFPSDASERRKGLGYLMAAFDRLLVRRPDARLVLAGPGDHRWVAEGTGSHTPGPASAAALGATVAVGVGDPSELAERYREATVTVLASTAEAFGLVLAESLACGTPVVGAEEGGIPEVLGAAPVGALVPYRDVEALAAALERTIELAGRPGTAERCARRARRFGWEEAVGPAHEELYAAVASRPRRGLCFRRIVRPTALA
jgi:phosphatidylinositol alpha-mannosyltransferase